jgi:hypothetical protein
MLPGATVATAGNGGGLVSRPSLAYFVACTAGLGLGAVRTYYDLLDVGVPFRVLGELHSGGLKSLAGAASAAAAAAAAEPPAVLRLLERLLGAALPPALSPALWGGVAADGRLIATRMLQSELGLFVALNWLVSVYCLVALLTTVSLGTACLV